jgi:hypothetical protein
VAVAPPGDISDRPAFLSRWLAAIWAQLVTMLAAAVITIPIPTGIGKDHREFHSSQLQVGGRVAPPRPAGGD